MADIDAELIERAIRWCAEAGRQTTPAQVRVALGSLKWDELLAARALLADPPPVVPLGPFALADVARGAPADVAAERERAGRYSSALADAAPEADASPPARARSRKKTPAPFVVRRAAQKGPVSEPPPRSLPLLDELMLEEGRAVLTRLVRQLGARRARICAALSAGWRRPDAFPISPEDLDRLLHRHGMARAFETRERDEILHAVRAAGGVLAAAAGQLGIDRPSLEAALDRLGARSDAERLRDRRRRELRSRGTLTQRAHLILDEGEQLADLGLLEEFVGDLRERLPDHLRALGGPAVESVAEGLCRTLTLDSRGVERLAHVTGIRLDVPPPRSPGARGSTARPSGPRPFSGPRAHPSRAPGARRPSSAPAPGIRPAASRGASPRTGGSHPASGRSGPDASRPPPRRGSSDGSRPRSGGRVGGGKRPGGPGGRRTPRKG